MNNFARGGSKGFCRISFGRNEHRGRAANTLTASLLNLPGQCPYREEEISQIIIFRSLSELRLLIQFENMDRYPKIPSFTSEIGPARRPESALVQASLRLQTKFAAEVNFLVVLWRGWEGMFGRSDWPTLTTTVASAGELVWQMPIGPLPNFAVGILDTIDY